MQKILKKLGLTEKQQAVYLALLQLGKGSATEIARLAQIKRPTTYDTLDELMERGLSYDIHEEKKHLYVAEDPKKLKEILKKQQKELDEHLPYLTSIFNAGADKPKVAYYKGFEGIKKVCEDILKSPKKSEVLGYVTAMELENPEMTSYFEEFVEKRAQKKIKFRGVYNYSKKMAKWLEKSDKQLREYKAVSKEYFPFSDEINIYGHKLGIMSYGQRPFGVIIESKSVADTQRSIFELVWRGLS